MLNAIYSQYEENRLSLYVKTGSYNVRAETCQLLPKIIEEWKLIEAFPKQLIRCRRGNDRKLKKRQTKCATQIKDFPYNVHKKLVEFSGSIS